MPSIKPAAPLPVAPFQQSLRAVEPEALGKLCFRATYADLSGEAVPEDGRQRSMRALLEWRQSRAGAGGSRAGGRAGTGGAAGSPPATPPKRFGGLTNYSGNFDEKQNIDLEMNRDLVDIFKPAAVVRQPPPQRMASDYNDAYQGYTESRVAACKPAEFEQPPNEVEQLLSQGCRLVKVSHSNRNHRKPPTELGVPAEPVPFAGCPHWMGAGTSANTYKESRYQLDYTSNRPASMRHQLSGAHSEPSLGKAVRDPHGVFRRATMRSQYKSEFDNAHNAPRGAPLQPRARDVRQIHLGH